MINNTLIKSASPNRLAVGDKIMIGVTRFDGHGYETILEEVVITKVNRLSVQAKSISNDNAYVFSELGSRTFISLKRSQKMTAISS